MMYQFEFSGVPSLEDAARVLGVDVGCLDAGFGVVELGPASSGSSFFSVRDCPGGGSLGGGSLGGGYSDPKIEHFGLDWGDWECGNS